ncbi:MAG: MFS transporter [Actinomycetota bacterium]
MGVDRGRTRATGLWAVGIVALGAAVAQAFGRFTYGVLLPAVRDELGISNSIAGLLGTINVGAYLTGTLLVAVATSSRRLLDVMRWGLVCSTVGLVLAAVAPGPIVLAIALAATGIGGAAIWIPAPVVAAGALAPERRSLAVGLMGSGIGLGIVFSGQLSATVRSTMGDDAWRTVYGVQASIAVVVLAVTVRWIGHDQDRPVAGRAGVGGFSVLRRMRGWVAITLAYTSFGFMYLLVIAFLTTRLEDDSGWTGSRASLAFTLLGLAAVVGGPIFIAAARRFGPGRVMATGFTLWSVAVILVLPGWTIPTLALSVALGLLFAGLPTTITLYFVENTSVDDYGPSFAAGTLAFGVAQMLSPQVGGLVADLTGSFTPVFLLSAGFALTGTAAALRLPRRKVEATAT